MSYHIIVKPIYILIFAPYIRQNVVLLDLLVITRVTQILLMPDVNLTHTQTQLWLAQIVLFYTILERNVMYHLIVMIMIQSKMSQ